MGKAGEVLRNVLEAYGISQNKLAVTMGVRRWDVGRWVHEHSDPTGESIIGITKALKEINPEAARDFARHYLGDIVESDESKGDDDHRS